MPDDATRPPVRHGPTGGAHASPPAGAVAGSEVSRGHLFENRVVERLVGHEFLQAGIFALELLQPLRLVQAETAVLLPPAVVRLLADAELLTDLRDPEAPT